jgi:hypothetical protein
MFTAKTTGQMLEDYHQLVALMAADPERQISSISLTRTDELEELSSSFAASLEV